jgi:hypothetical protein
MGQIFWNGGSTKLLNPHFIARVALPITIDKQCQSIQLIAHDQKGNLLITRLHNVTHYSVHTPLLFDAITMEKSSLNVKSCVVMISFNPMDAP